MVTRAKFLRNNCWDAAWTSELRDVCTRPVKTGLQHSEYISPVGTAPHITERPIRWPDITQILWECNGAWRASQVVVKWAHNRGSYEPSRACRTWDYAIGLRINLMRAPSSTMTSTITCTDRRTDAWAYYLKRLANPHFSSTRIRATVLLAARVQSESETLRVVSHSRRQRS